MVVDMPLQPLLQSPRSSATHLPSQDELARMTIFLPTNQPRSLLAWPNAGWAARPWAAMVRAVMTVGACIALLNMLSLLPCISHCAQDETPPASASAWFLCDLHIQAERSSLPPVSHHHHATPRVAFEPILVQLGLITTPVLLISPLFRSANHVALRLTSAPPTPPPRAA